MNLRNQLLKERRQYVEEKGSLHAKITELESRNQELIERDMEIGQLQNEIVRMNDLMKASDARERDLQEKLSECKLVFRMGD